MEKIYYADQKDWGMDDFYALNRYLNRMFLKSEKRMEEIKSLSPEKMSEITKVLICIIVRFQRKESLLNTVELKQLLEVPPLKTRLNLVEDPTDCHELYVQYNVGL